MVSLNLNGQVIDVVTSKNQRSIDRMNHMERYLIPLLSIVYLHLLVYSIMKATSTNLCKCGTCDGGLEFGSNIWSGGMPNYNYGQMNNVQVSVVDSKLEGNKCGTTAEDWLTN